MKRIISSVLASVICFSLFSTCAYTEYMSQPGMFSAENREGVPDVFLIEDSAKDVLHDEGIDNNSDDDFLIPETLSQEPQFVYDDLIFEDSEDFQDIMNDDPDEFSDVFEFEDKELSEESDNNDIIVNEDREFFLLIDETSQDFIPEDSTGEKNVVSPQSSAGSAPVILSQPGNVTAAIGTKARFSIKAEGSGLTYQWQYKTATGKTWSKSTASGSQTPELKVSVTAGRDGHRYRCIVTASNGAKATSNTVKLTAKPVITVQPADINAALGTYAKFTVQADGKGLSYQWQWRGTQTSQWAITTVSGYNTPTLKVPVTESTNGHYYRCVVTSSNGTAIESNGARLGVKTKITSQPSDAAAKIGATAVYTVKAEGIGLTYKWQYRTASGTTWSSSTASGNTSNVLKVPVTASRNKYSYRCVITSANGKKVYSRAATLTVSTSITSQPANKTGAPGTKVKFTVKATGIGLTYQWQYKTASGTSWKKSSATGNATATLTVPVTAGRDGYSYRCVITSANGTKSASKAAKLSVCGMSAKHKFVNGICSLCGYECDHMEHNSEGKCTVCGVSVPHVYGNDHICGICGYDIRSSFFTRAIPGSYNSSCSKPGKTAKISYNSIDYHTAERNRITKNMTVYTPYGYDPSQKYNVVILIPGYGGDAGSFMTDTMKNSIDNLMAAGKIDPCIVVNIVWHNDISTPGFHWVWENDTKQMGNELRDVILPYIVSHYSTYAASGSTKAIAAARDHFGVLGLSYGAEMVLSGVIPNEFDLFGWYSVISNPSREWYAGMTNTPAGEFPEPKTGAADTAKIIAGSQYSADYIYFGCGCKELEIAYDSTLNQYNTLLNRSGGKLNQNTASFTSISDTGHDENMSQASMLNSLMIFFH